MPNRRLRALEARGVLALEWTLSAAGAGPRYERRVALTADGRDIAVALAAGERPPGRALGPRQAAALAELLAAPDPAVAATDVADRHGHATVAGLARRGLVAVEVRERPRDPLAARPPGLRGARPPGASLTEPQEAAVALIRRAIADRDPTPLLLDGVTGGGKTAIYVEAIAAALEAGRPALVLVPEIALATPIVDRLRADLGVRVALVHSGLSDGERADEWRRIRAGDVDIVAGTRLAVLAPLRDVGRGDRRRGARGRLQERPDAAAPGPRHRDPPRRAGAGGRRPRQRDAGGRQRRAGPRRGVSPGRPADAADGRAAGGRGRRSPRGAPGRQSRADLGAAGRGARGAGFGPGDQAILVINRRGTASVVLCRDCGHVQACPDCDRPLVFHQAGGTLRCHHCGRAFPLASRCPNCHSARIKYLGGGTERVEREVRERFPGLRAGRLDRDVVERRGAAERVLDAFAAGQLDVLVGTSLVAKGLDVPNVTLVGVVSADVSLNLPDERAAERTYQLLAQAVGRAGRGERRGTAIIQSYQPEHPAIRAVADDDAAAFYDAELELRRRFGSPPFGRLVKLTCGLEDRAAAETTARAMADDLRRRAAERDSDTAVIGPAPAYIARRADRWRWNVVLRGSDPVALLGGGLDAPWSVDVDPESLL